MSKIILSLVAALFGAKSYAMESPCFWSGTLVKCLPSTGIYLDNLKSLRLGTDNDTNYVELKAVNGMSGNYTITWPAAAGSTGQVLYATDSSASLGWRDAGISQATLDSALASVLAKKTVDLVCHSNVTLSGVQTCDGQSTSGAALVLVMGQTDPTENGLYSNDDFGSWVRAGNMPAFSNLPGSVVSVNEQGAGTAYQDTLWLGHGDASTTGNFYLVPTAADNNKLTASRAITSDANSHLAVSATTATELGYVSGVTSAIQTQLGTKTTNPGTTAGDITYCSNTATPCTSTRLGIGSSATVLHGGSSAPSYAAVGLTTDVTGTLPLGNGGTAATTKAGAFDSLSPMTNAGDIIYGGTSGTGTRLGIGAATTVLHGGTTAPSYSAIVSGDITDGTIVNADISSSAAIDGSKVTAASGSAYGTTKLPGSMVVCDSPGAGAAGYGSTNGAIRRFQNCTTTGSDITYADSSTAGATFTINADGIYAINRWDGGAAAGSQIGISVNSNQLTTAVASITTANRIGYNNTHVVNDITNVSTTYRFANGDVIRPHDNNPGAFTNSGASNQMIVTQVYKF